MPTTENKKWENGNVLWRLIQKFVIQAEVRNLKLIKVIKRNMPLTWYNRLFLLTPRRHINLLKCRKTLLTSINKAHTANPKYILQKIAIQKALHTYKRNHMLREFYATSTGEGCLNNIGGGGVGSNDNGDCNENVKANKCNQQNKHAFWYISLPSLHAGLRRETS